MPQTYKSVQKLHWILVIHSCTTFDCDRYANRRFDHFIENFGNSMWGFHENGSKIAMLDSVAGTSNIDIDFIEPELLNDFSGSSHIGRIASA